MKCPYCNEELESVLQLVGAGGLVEEAYLLCSKCNIRGERKLWQELIKAIDGLLAVWRATSYTTKQGSIAYNVLRDLNIKPLDRIKTLDQIKQITGTKGGNNE